VYVCFCHLADIPTETVGGKQAPALYFGKTGSGRAIGTVLAGPALESIKSGKAYYGEVPILGTPYITGYEPITDSSGGQIGVYYVGYKK